MSNSCRTPNSQVPGFRAARLLSAATYVAAGLLVSVLGGTPAGAQEGATASLPTWTITDIEPPFDIANIGLYWLDNDQVLFRSKESGLRGAHYNNHISADQVGYLYTASVDGRISRYSDEPVQLFCVADGTVRMNVEPDKNGVSYQGMKVSQFLPAILGIRDRTTRWQRIPCENMTAPGYVPDYVHDFTNWTALLERHGFITHRRTYPAPPVVEFFPPGARTAKPLPYTEAFPGIAKYFWPSFLRYYAYRDAYFGWLVVNWDESMRADRQQLLENANCRPAWWLYPYGRLEFICLPHGPWDDPETGGIWRIVPVKAGYFVLGVHNPKRTEAEAASYLISGGQIRKVFSGRVSMPLDVGEIGSPDGCRVAFLHTGRNPTRTSLGVYIPKCLAIVDFCPGRSAQNPSQLQNSKPPGNAINALVQPGGDCDLAAGPR